MDGKSGLSEEAKNTLHELLEYAESLGIVETLRFDDTNNDAVTTAKATAEQKHFKYLIVIDFESTCWGANDKPARTRPPEIIGRTFRQSNVCTFL